MKKVFTILLFIMFLFAGCTKNKETETKSELNSNATPSETIVPTNIIPSSIPTTDSANQNDRNKEVPSDPTQIGTPSKNDIVTSANPEDKPTQVVIPADNQESITSVGIKPENSSNYGYITSEGDYIYFWSGTSIVNNDDGKFCKMKKDGTEFSVLSEDSPCSMNNINGKLYYISQKDLGLHSGPICQIDKDGNNRTVLIDEDCSDLIVTEEYIYFINKSDGGKIYRADLDGKNVHLLEANMSLNLQYDNGFLYYEVKEDNQLFRMKDGDNNNSEMLIDNFYYYIVHDSNIYFLRDWILYKYSIETKKESILHNDRIYGFTLGENMIYCLGYFNKTSDGRGLYAYDIASISLDETCIKIVRNHSNLEDIIFSLYFFDNYIYYCVENHEGMQIEIARFKTDDDEAKYLGDYVWKND